VNDDVQKRYESLVMEDSRNGRINVCRLYNAAGVRCGARNGRNDGRAGDEWKERCASFGEET
jgi:hypothetical protein